ncbi:family 16 glycosylhydrolase [Nocardioides sp. CER19]|uniref:family 16 glycosylhydrolase n=1 Tax=Nocardioides sp. CER19 TaxID=3038538 RepID=UPI00244A2DC5|nr:family 16 glycosylhydrolase [Nocardioides sp. CER19]MDH2413497.1 family 16 glycosylhydrolase [Nocardioides sp. CER19]
MRRRLIVLGLLLAALLPLAPATAGTPGACGRASGCTAFELIHAGSTYGWYPVAQRFEFKGGVPAQWQHLGRGTLTTTHGMLTLQGRRGDISTVWTGNPRRQGRWEVRMRTHRLQAARTDLTDYRVRVALVPTRPQDEHCGAQQVALLDYSPTSPRSAAFSVRALPDLAFDASTTTARTVGGDQWHEFAVEVAPDHVSWFVDARVVATQPTPAALFAVPLRMQVSLVSTPGASMQPTRVQLDWARYWTLRKPGKLPVDAPAPTASTYAGAC